MIRHPGLRWAALAVAFVVTGACSGGKDADYCKNHYEFHPEHLASIATLNIDVAENGELDARLTVPRAVVGNGSDQNIRSMFADPGRSFTVQSDSACALALDDVRVDNGNLVASYGAQCGANNKLGAIDVALFDQLDDLGEVVVSVTTPATRKHFGISRQCDKPMFRLEK